MNIQSQIDDLEYLLRTLPKKHADLFSLIPKEKYEQAITKTEKKITNSNLNTREFSMELMKIFAQIKDPHTTVEFPEDFRPLSFNWINGDFYAVVVPQEKPELLGQKLIRIDDHPIEQFANLVDSFIVYDNEEIYKVELSRALSNPELSKYSQGLALNKQLINVRYEFESGVTIEQEIPISDYKGWQSSFSNVPGNEWFTLNRKYRLVEINNIIYLQYRACREDPKYKFEQLEEEFEKMLTKEPKTLIIDLRQNQGGDSSLLLPLLDKVKKFIDEKKISSTYTLINRLTFSSGVYTIYEIQRRFPTTLIGQPTSQGINHFGLTGTFILPRSKISINYSQKYFDLIDDNSKIVKPDIFVEPTIQEFLEGRDSVLNKAIELSKMI